MGEGTQVGGRHLVAVVRARLEGLLEGWDPERGPELVQLLGPFATEVVPGVPVLSRGSTV